MLTIQEYFEKQRPENTTKKTGYDINVWNRYCLSIGEPRNLENILANELNVLLCKFFMNVRKKDGCVYEPSFLTSFQRSIQRHLKDKHFSFNIFQDMEFAKSREFLLAKKRELVEK